MLDGSAVIHWRNAEVVRTNSPFVARVSYQPSCHWPWSRYPLMATSCGILQRSYGARPQAAIAGANSGPRSLASRKLLPPDRRRPVALDLGQCDGAPLEMQNASLLGLGGRPFQMRPACHVRTAGALQLRA